MNPYAHTGGAYEDDMRDREYVSGKVDERISELSRDDLRDLRDTWMYRRERRLGHYSMRFGAWVRERFVSDADREMRA